MIKKIKQMFAIKTNSRKQLMTNLLSNYMKKNTNLFLICKNLIITAMKLIASYQNIITF